MSLTKCPECGHEVSKKARTCPSCGHRKKQFLDGCGTVIVILILVIIVIWFVGAGLII
jgi:uncharacterized OB-fold protein